MDERDALAIIMTGMIGGTKAATDMVDNMGRQKVGTAGELAILPKPHSPGDQIALETQGVTFGEPVGPRGLDADLRKATVPKGWTKRNTDHYLYTELVDDKGRKRAQMMTHYQDGDAWISAVPAFTADGHSDSYEEDAKAYPAIKDSNGKIVWRGKAVPGVGYEARKEAERTARVLLHKKFRKYATIRAKLADLRAKNEAGKITWAEHREQTAPLEAALCCCYWIGKIPQLPPSESEPEPGEMYTLHVAIYRDGHHVDSGDNRTRRCLSDDDAVKKLSKDAEALLGSYDEIRWTVRCDQRKVDSGVARTKRRTQFRSSTMADQMFGRGIRCSSYFNHDESDDS